MEYTLYGNARQAALDGHHFHIAVLLSSRGTMVSAAERNVGHGKEMQDTSQESDLEGTYLHDCPSNFVLTDTTFQHISQVQIISLVMKNSWTLHLLMILLGNMNNQYNNS